MGRGDRDLDKPGAERGRAAEGRGDGEWWGSPGRSAAPWMRTVPTTASASPPSVESAQIGMACASIASRSSSAKMPCSAQKTWRRRAAQARLSQALVANFTRKWLGR
jgi:hypothetical protein